MYKNIYFYWGNETMSYMRYMTLYSFRKFNPDWCINLIVNKQLHERILKNTIEKQDKTEFIGKDYSFLVKDLNITVLDFENSMLNLDYNVVKHMSDVHIKDLLNWKLLANGGGIVADMDILFTKPVGDTINTVTDIGLICFSNYPKKCYIPVSFMYSSGSNAFFNNVYNNALKSYNPSIYESCGTLCIKEKNLIEVRKNYSDLSIQKLKDSIVFPFIDYPWYKGIEMLYNTNNRHLMKDNSIGIHWYGGAPLSQHYNNLLNEKTIYEINNTISMSIREILLCQNHNNQK